MIPDFLTEFKEELEKFKLESIKIHAIPIAEDETLDIARSKFLGTPYLPEDFKYPLDKNGKPSILIAQINFSEVPALENYPVEGILQFYVSPTDWYDMDDYTIIYHPNISETFQTDFSFLTTDLYEDSPVYCEHKLEFEKTIEYGGSQDSRFDMEFNGKDFYEFCEELNETQLKQIEDIIDGAGHKIGGYAYFTQSDPREYNENKSSDLLLLQIDTDEHIMFGDSGVGNFFIHPDDLKSKNFEKIWFNWDCC